MVIVCFLFKRKKVFLAVFFPRWWYKVFLYAIACFALPNSELVFIYHPYCSCHHVCVNEAKEHLLIMLCEGRHFSIILFASFLLIYFTHYCYFKEFQAPGSNFLLDYYRSFSCNSFSICGFCKFLLEINGP